jgi:hypothetical protein
MTKLDTSLNWRKRRKLNLFVNEKKIQQAEPVPCNPSDSSLAASQLRHSVCVRQQYDPKVP